jgi:hypothetical protein
MAAGPQRPSGAATNFDYWLGRCQGFRVDSQHRRVGVVEEVRYTSRCDRPDVIAVRPRRLRGLLFIVPVEEVAKIFPGRELVVLRRSPRPTATGRRPDLRGRFQHRGQREVSRGPNASDPEPCTSKAHQEVETVITRLTRRVGLRFGRGGEKKVTPEFEESAGPSAEEPSAEGQAKEERAADEPPAEGAAEAAAAEEPAPEQAAAEGPPPEEETTP